MLENLIKQHSGKWYEVVVYCKPVDDAGVIMAKFLHPGDALEYANNLLEASNSLYNLIVVR